MVKGSKGLLYFTDMLPADTSMPMEPSTQSAPVVHPTETADPLLRWDESLSATSMKKRKRFPSKPWHKVVLGLVIALVIFGSIAGVVGAYTMGVVKEMQTQSVTMQAKGRAAYDEFKAQNLPATEQNLKDIQEELKTVRKTYSKLAFYNAIPIAHSYYQDGVHGLNAADKGVEAGLKSI